MIVILTYLVVRQWKKGRDVGGENARLRKKLDAVNVKYGRQVVLNEDLILKLQIAKRSVKVRERKVIVRDTVNDTTVTERIIYVPREGKIDVIVDTSGEVVVKVKNKGFCFEPFLTVGLLQENLFIGLNFRLLYFRRFGIYMGLIYDNEKFGGIIGSDYVLDKIAFLQNSRLGINFNPINKKMGIDFGIYF